MDLKYAKEHSSPMSQRVSMVASGLSLFVVVVMVAIFTSNVADYKRISDTVTAKHLNNPHYRGDADKMNHCDDCHDYPSDMCEKHGQTECLDCHAEDGKATRLKHNSVLVLCTRCHTEDIFIAYEKDGKWHEVDISHNHPYGAPITDVTYPKTLPMDERGIICVTCHDVHIQETNRRMLRLYSPENGKPGDVKPLCHDCHHENGIL